MLSLLATWMLIGTPGPASVLVIANQSVSESVQLARIYRDARDVPESQVCLVQTSSASDVSMEMFKNSLWAQIRTCMISENLEDRIDTFVLAKGMPLRVYWTVDGSQRLVSLAAALMVAESTFLDGRPFLGTAPGIPRNCGGAPCYGARWNNPFRDSRFGPGWNKVVGDVHWRLRLVTMLNGRTFADAARLITSATTAESQTENSGTFLFMNGGDPARSSQDFQYSSVMDELKQRGFENVERVSYSADLEGKRLASFMVGTLALESSIEGNQFSPGSLVDNLTSFGAHPHNFSEDKEVQVSIARWVAKGVGGVHGTTAEPLANSFPERMFLVDYVDGMSLSQAFYRRMPFVYWQNLVLGDPLLAPYARRPKVVISGLESSETIAGSRNIRVDAVDEEQRGIASLVVYVNGRVWKESQGQDIEGCLTVDPTNSVQILAVAQVDGLGDEYDQYLPKGWSSKTVSFVSGPRDCTGDKVDAGLLADSGEVIDASSKFLDASLNLGVESDSTTCGCHLTLATSASPSGVWLFLLLVLRRRSRS